MDSGLVTKANKLAMSERLQAARWLAGLSMRAVASTIGVSAPAVAGWEKGTLPESPHRAALAELYGVDEAILFAEVESQLNAARELLRPA
jgi:transcriptional regulator with XRE-family HTH domain